jgi:hypothetical protein
MDDDDATRRIADGLRAQLQQSRQQEERLERALTRVLELVDEATSPR